MTVEQVSRVVQLFATTCQASQAYILSSPHSDSSPDHADPLQAYKDRVCELKSFHCTQITDECLANLADGCKDLCALELCSTVLGYR